MDKIIQDNQVSEYQKAKITAEGAGVIVLENNPCFEIWLLLHFVSTGKLFNNCSEVVNELSNRIAKYSKSQKFLINSRLYHRYRLELQAKAIPNAKKLEVSRTLQDILYPRAETFRFFEWYYINN